MTLAPRHLRIEQRGRVLQVLLDNPPANFLTTAVMQELADLLEDLEQRQDIGAVILSGAADGVFLTHFDVDEIEHAVAPITFSMRHACCWKAKASCATCLGRGSCCGAPCWQASPT
ncbi:enoyl-CoA hydratase-related protein [Pseudomonas aeruginosa]